MCECCCDTSAPKHAGYDVENQMYKFAEKRLRLQETKAFGSQTAAHSVSDDPRLQCFELNRWPLCHFNFKDGNIGVDTLKKNVKISCITFKQHKVLREAERSLMLE